MQTNLSKKENPLSKSRLAQIKLDSIKASMMEKATTTSCHLQTFLLSYWAKALVVAWELLRMNILTGSILIILAVVLAIIQLYKWWTLNFKISSPSSLLRSKKLLKTLLVDKSFQK